MPIIKKSLKNAAARQVDDALKITELFNDPTAHLDIAIADLKGSHGLRLNNVSDKFYLVLEGEGTVIIGDESVKVAPMDVVFIPPGVTHGITGNLKFLVIMTPPFDPKIDVTAGVMPQCK